MDSARSYKAVSYSYRRFDLKDYSSVNSGLNDNTGDMSGETGASESSTVLDPQKNNKFMPLNGISTLQEKMSKVRYNYKVRSGELRDRETIRQESIKYIFELLFGKNSERYKKWMEQHSTPDIGQETGIGTYETSNSTGFNTYGNGNPIGAGTYETFNPNGLSTFRIAGSTDFMRADYQYESEETTFSSRGTVRTADGREISFNIDVQMSREFESYYEERMQMNVNSLKNGQAALCDPLVINLEGNVAAVSDQLIRFDIDGDGELDTINRLAGGSGYLALDKNNDGKINDGTELFGTASGDGFADLAKYDKDGNGWIDENDDIWNKLKIMTYDENGKEQLYTLAQTGVGAICLSKVKTEFSQKDDNQATNSVIRSTGVFLYENGIAGTIQHLDVAKYKQEA